MSAGQAKTFRAALVQLRSSRNIAHNLDAAESLIRDAASSGARYVQTPENTALMELDPGLVFSQAQVEPESAPLARFRTLAGELGIWLHIGSLGIKIDAAYTVNRSYLLDPRGAIAARYDKIHMFDVDLPGGETYRESQYHVPGNKAVLAELPLGACHGWLGMTICYDLRFPALYRALAEAGANMIAVPAAFTKQTGEAHWHVLLRARAIETGAFVFAAAQGGLHDNGRETFGHSMIVSPWGEILAEAGEDPCVVAAEVDLSDCDAVRARIPSLKHGRPFEVEIVPDQAAPGRKEAS